MPNLELTNSNLECFTPTISCDVRLGAMVCDLEVNTSFFAEFIAERSDAAIGEVHTINFSADCVEEYDPGDPEPYYSYGYYDPQTRTATINIGSIQSKVEHTRQQSTKTDTELNELGDSEASKTTLHELSHGIDHSTMHPDDRLMEKLLYVQTLLPPFQPTPDQNPDEIKGARRLHNIELLARMENLTQDEYVQEPEEARARAAEELVTPLNTDQYPVRIQFK